MTIEISSKAIAAAASVITLITSLATYVVKNEVQAQVQEIRERQIAVETLVPEMAGDIREIKEDVNWIRRNFFHATPPPPLAPVLPAK